MDLDGYLEPCGCQQHPLGGIDRLAQFISRERAATPNSVLVSAGNTFFEYPTLDSRMVTQERAKAESLTHILDGLGLAAYAPGPGDFALGAAEGWRALSTATHAPALASNAGLGAPVLREVGGVRVGIVGVSDFRPADGVLPPGAPSATDAVGGGARGGGARGRRARGWWWCSRRFRGGWRARSARSRAWISWWPRAKSRSPAARAHRDGVAGDGEQPGQGPRGNRPVP